MLNFLLALKSDNLGNFVNGNDPGIQVLPKTVREVRGKIGCFSKADQN